MLDLRVGDLVTPKNYCKGSGRVAILTEIANGYDACKFQWIDEGLKDGPKAGILTNFQKVTKDHERKNG